MSIFKRIKEYLTGKFERRNLANPPKWLVELLGSGIETKSGVKISEDNAFQSSAVYACVRVLGESVASLPLFVYQRLQQGKEKAFNHSLFKVLHHLPNPLMTSFEFRETLMGHLLTWGNAYAEIERNKANQIIGLWPLLPNKMRIEGKDRILNYFYTLPGGKEVPLDPGSVFHVKGLSKNGFIGQSVIGFAREAIGLSVAVEDFGSRFFSNNTILGGTLEHPGRLSPDAKENLRKSFEEQHAGLSMAHRTAILEEGMKYSKIGIPPEDAQFLETRKFQTTEIARIYRVPPHMIGDLEKATFSNIEHQSLDFVIHSLRPWLVRWEQAILRDLFEEDEREVFFAEFLVDGLLRGDIESRFKAYQTGWQMGALNQDEIREMENRNPIPGGRGQLYYVPLNFAPIGAPPEDQRTNGHDRTEEGYHVTQHTNI